MPQVKVIDVDSNDLTLASLVDSIPRNGQVILRRRGKVIARMESADDVDLDDMRWAKEPKQVARGREAVKRYKAGKYVRHDDLKRRLGRS